MGTKILLETAIGTNAATDEYVPIFAGAGGNAVLTTEAHGSCNFYRGGNLSRLHIMIISNSHASSMTIRIQKNTAATDSAISIAAGATGYFEDTTGITSVAAGDDMDFLVDRPGGTNSRWGGLGCFYDQGIEAEFNSGICGNSSFSVASTTSYIMPVGTFRASATDDALIRIQQNTTVTVKNMQLYVVTNARTSSTTITLRKDGSDTALVLTVGAGTTGFFENTTNTETYTATTHSMAFKLVTGTGAGAFTPSFLGLVLKYPDKRYQISGADVTGKNLSGTSASYFGISAVAGVSASESATIVRMQGSGTFRKMYMYVSANTASATSTLFLRKNAADTALTFTVGSGATGLFSDTSNEVTYVEDDEITFKYIKATGTGGIVLRWTTLECEPDNDFVPKIRYY